MRDYNLWQRRIYLFSWLFIKLFKNKHANLRDDMSRNYWLDLFTGKTWDEFIKSGANVSGFKERRRNIASKIKPGDYLLCYLTGLGRFIGVLEVLSTSYVDSETRIWEDQLFPIRFKALPKIVVSHMDLCQCAEVKFTD